jgi:hypothetical protein
VAVSDCVSLTARTIFITVCEHENVIAASDFGVN